MIEEEHTVPVKGEKLTFHEVRVPIRNSAGEITGVCGIGRDITERRSAMMKPEIALSGYRSRAMKDTMELPDRPRLRIVSFSCLERADQERTILPDGYMNIRHDLAVLTSVSTARQFLRIWQNPSSLATRQELLLGQQSEKDYWNLQRAVLCC